MTLSKPWLAPFALALLASPILAGEPSQLAVKLKAGQKQTLVTYGTSLTAGGAWVGQLKQALDKRYPGLVTVVNSGQGAMWSKWGVENLDKRVIDKAPDTVLIEFAINDAFLEYKTSVESARKNLESMIERIHKAHPKAEVILMTMNPPTGVHLERRPKIDDYYQMYRDVAKDKKLKLIDNAPAWEAILKNDPALFKKYVPDGIHPEAEGCRQVITPAILKGLGLGEK